MGLTAGSGQYVMEIAAHDDSTRSKTELTQHIGSLNMAARSRTLANYEATCRTH
jgi:hypothetical protein